MKKIVNLTLVLTLIILFKNKDLITNSIAISFLLWEKFLIPSIYPILIITELLINNRIDLIIPKFINKIFNKIFKFDGQVIPIFLLGIISGSPTSSLIYQKAYYQLLISKNDYQKLVICGTFINPLFFIKIANTNIKMIIFILLLNYTYALISFIIIKPSNIVLKNNQVDNKNLINIITDNFKVMLNILSIIIISNIFIVILSYYHFNQFIIGNIEITNGLNYFTNPFNIAFLASFLGIAINCQIKSIINNQRLYNTYLIHQIIKSLICACATSMLTQI